MSHVNIAPGSGRGTLAASTTPTHSIRFVDDSVDILSPQTIPFLKLIGIDGEEGDNVKFEWFEDELLAETGVVKTGGANSVVGSSSASNNKVYMAVEVLKNFQKGNVILIGTEAMWASDNPTIVTDDSDSYLPVVRGVGGTSRISTIANDDPVTIVGIAVHENADAPIKGTTVVSPRFNYFQAFDMAYQVSHRQANTKLYGVEQGDDDYQLEKAITEVFIKLERAAIQGVRQAQDATLPSMMGGLDWYINTTNSTHLPANHVVSLSGGPIGEKDLSDLLQTLYLDVGADKMARTIICGPWVKRKISDMFAPYARTTRNERTGGVVVETLDTEFGNVDVVMSFRCPASTAFFVNLDYLKVHPFKNSRFHDRELPAGGAFVKREVYGDYSMKVKNIKAHGKITGISTTS